MCVYAFVCLCALRAGGWLEVGSRLPLALARGWLEVALPAPAAEAGLAGGWLHACMHACAYIRAYITTNKCRTYRQCTDTALEKPAAKLPLAVSAGAARLA